MAPKKPRRKILSRDTFITRPVRPAPERKAERGARGRGAVEVFPKDRFHRQSYPVDDFTAYGLRAIAAARGVSIGVLVNGILTHAVLTHAREVPHTERVRRPKPSEIPGFEAIKKFFEDAGNL